MNKEPKLPPHRFHLYYFIYLYLPFLGINNRVWSNCNDKKLVGTIWFMNLPYIEIKGRESHFKMDFRILQSWEWSK